MTTVEIGATVGLKKRATQDHLAHLFARARIDADRRTPLSGASVGQPALPGAQQWAASVLAPDPTCARCLVALAGVGWDGQFSMEELAEAAGVSLRSVERHRPHLRDANLVRLRPVTVKVGPEGHRVRMPDHFTLLSGIRAPKLTGAAWDDAPEVARNVIAAVRWFTGVSEAERANATAAVTWVLRNGWPREALLRELDATLDRQAYRPGGYLHKLLRKLPPEYILPAQETYTGRTAPRVTECLECGAAVKTTTPGSVRCTPCYTARERAATMSAPVFKIA